MEAEYARLIAQLGLQGPYQVLKKYGTPDAEIVNRIEESLRKHGIQGGRDLARVLFHRLENPRELEEPQDIAPPAVRPSVRPPHAWPREQKEALLASFKVRSESYTKPVSEPNLIRLAMARGIPEADALHLIIDLGREGHWRPRVVNGNVLWENGFQPAESWAVHADGY